MTEREILTHIQSVTLNAMLLLTALFCLTLAL